MNGGVNEMALIAIHWDLPPDENMGLYKNRIFLSDEESASWITTMMKQPGFKELRAFRNPFRTTPQTLVLCEFDSLESCMKYVESENYSRLLSELRKVGCTNISAQLWGTSPMIPEPLKPQRA